jgi:hypothetical protein
MNGGDGFVYVATGATYRLEAARSAATVRALHPGARICLMTDKIEGAVFWNDVIVLEKPSFGMRDKIAMRLCPYERWVYLDTDTRVIGNLAEMFQLLDRFDFAGHQLFEGHDCPVEGIPDAFPEFQGGVLAFRRSPAVEAFFARWLELYDRNYALNSDGHYDVSNVSDQKTLRTALYESKLALAVLSPEYNFRPAHVNFACATVRVLHGRGRLDALADRINRRLGNRVYIPRLDALLSEQTPADELVRLWGMTTLQILRLGAVALTPLGFRNWLRRSPTVRRLFLRGDYSEKLPDHAAIWREPSATPPTRPGQLP